MSQENDDRISKTTLIISIAITIVIMLFSLEKAGMIRHNEDKSAMPIADYKVIFIEEGQESRMSYKPSNQTASCIDGYLFITSDTDNGMQGIVVDYKNRGVKCQAKAFH